ncbi:MAG: TraR/DksA C4-type zinc finger protein [Desulfobulbaceae bacterium]|nr:TraR/DksA C4-type zinc finger protein [Desulfobulbaceae bacterium]
MTGIDAKRLRELLLGQRQEVFGRLQRLDAEWQELGERDIELEEEAQKADRSRLFDQLERRDQERIEEIDLALTKMATGSYGLCEGCRHAIDAKRLNALPATRLCGKCARRYEAEQMRLPEARQFIGSVPLPVEYRNMTDEEVEEGVVDFLVNEGSIDLDELEIVCENGVLSLEGMIPSKKEHQILLRTLTDVLGFAAIIDHLQISDLPWEGEERTPGNGEAAKTVEKIGGGGDLLTDDLFVAEEEGRPYLAPETPPAETE